VSKNDKVCHCEQSVKALQICGKSNGEECLKRKAFIVENDRFEIYDRCPISDVSMAISTDTDADADVAWLSHLAVTGDRDVITADRDISDCDQLLW